MYQWYHWKCCIVQLVVAEKTQNLRRLEAQRNELNAKGDWKLLVYLMYFTSLFFLLFKLFYRVRLILALGTRYRLIPLASVRYRINALISAPIPDAHCVCVTKSIVLCFDCTHQTKKKNETAGAVWRQTFISGYWLFTSVSVIISSYAMFPQLSICVCLYLCVHLICKWDREHDNPLF